MEIKFPIQGLHAGVAYQDQPPLTSFSLSNVMPLNVGEQRLTGGQRPGTTKWDSTQIGGGAYPVMGICTITTTYITPSA